MSLTEAKLVRIRPRQLCRDITLDESFTGVFGMSVTPDVIRTADMANYTEAEADQHRCEPVSSKLFKYPYPFLIACVLSVQVVLGPIKIKCFD